jgi:hypothetical protein
MSYYLVRINGNDDRPEETSAWIGRHLAVTFHMEVAVRPWAVDLDAPYLIDRSDAWHLFEATGDKFVPTIEEVVVDGIGEDGASIAPKEQADA